jgi:hypothetical protein
MKYKMLIVAIVILVAIVSYELVNRTTGNVPVSNVSVQVAGWRVVNYGSIENPWQHTQNDPTYWVYVAREMQAKFPGSSPGGIYGIGHVETNGRTYMPFHAPTGYSGIAYVDFQTNEIIGDGHDYTDEDLTAFDNASMKILLQVEPGSANVSELATMILNKYKSHKSVVGFSVDLEWYEDNVCPGGCVLTTAVLNEWVSTVKSIDSNYVISVKHFDPSKISGTVPGVIYNTDTCCFATFDEAIKDYVTWYNRFPNNPLIYQIGYNLKESSGKSCVNCGDTKWWSLLNDPPIDIVNAIKSHAPNANIWAVCWVDFSVHKLFPVIPLPGQLR